MSGALTLTANEALGLSDLQVGESMHEGKRGIETGLRMDIVRRACGRGLDKAMSFIASDPDKARSVLETMGKVGADLVPFLGPVVKYADARELYRAGHVKEAKRLCCIAAAEMVLDVATLGGSAAIPDELLTALTTVRQGMKNSSTASKVLKTDPLSFTADMICHIPGVDDALTAMLTFGMEDLEVAPGSVTQLA